MSKYALLALGITVFLVLTNQAEASLAVGRLMRPGRSLAVGRTFRPGRSLASGRPFFRPGKRVPEVEEFYMAARDEKVLERSCQLEVIDGYTAELIEVVKSIVDFERECGSAEEIEAPTQKNTTKEN